LVSGVQNLAYATVRADAASFGTYIVWKLVPESSALAVASFCRSDRAWT
jgi:hypothetical protein